MPSESLSQILAVLVSALVAGRFGFALVREALAEDVSGVSREFEAMLPLKGRWLRALGLAPAHLFLTLVVFVGSCSAFMLLASIVLALLQGLRRFLNTA